MRGNLYILEGPDGCGKTTIAKRVASGFAGKAVYMSFPCRNDNTIGKIVYQIHHNKSDFKLRSLSPTGLQALHVATHLDSIALDISPTLESGMSIFLDRFWWTTWVYGRAFGADPNIVDALLAAESLAWRGITPSHAFLITRKCPFRVEYSEKWEALNEGYNAVVERERSKYPISIIVNDRVLSDAVSAIEMHCQLTK